MYVPSCLLVGEISSGRPFHVSQFLKDPFHGSDGTGTPHVEVIEGRGSRQVGLFSSTTSLGLPETPLPGLEPGPYGRVDSGRGFSFLSDSDDVSTVQGRPGCRLVVCKGDVFLILFSLTDDELLTPITLIRT